MRARRRIKSQRLTKIYWHKVRVIFLIIASIFLLFGLYWLFFISSFFQIKTILINGAPNTEALQSDIEHYFHLKNQKFVPAIFYDIFPQFKHNQENVLLFSSSGLVDYLTKKYPELEKVETYLKLKDNSLTVNLVYRKIFFLLCGEQNKCYFLDDNGVVFAKAPETSGHLIRTIFIHRAEPFIGQTILTLSDLKFLSNIFELSEQKDSPLTIKRIELQIDEASVIKIATNAGWHLLIDFNSNIRHVFRIIKELAGGELKDKMSKLQYIECRYLPRIYYKFINS